MRSARPVASSLLDGPAPVASAVARLDPRTRVVAALAFALVMVAAERPAALGAGLGLAAALALLARLPLVPTLRRLAGIEAFMAALLLLLPFTVPGRPLVELAGLSASAEGVARALALGAKAGAVALAVQALLGGLEVVSLGHALARLGVPSRFVTLFLSTVRYVDVLHRQYQRLRLAMRARAFRPAAGAHTWRSMGWLFGMLLVTSLERSERIHAAMRLRGFTGAFPRLDEPAPRALDHGFAAAHLGLLAALVVLDRT